MTIRKRIIEVFIAVFSLSFIVFLAGCTTIEEQREEAEYYSGQLTLFMNGPGRAYQDITFNLLAVNIVSDDGVSREVMNTPMTINSLDLENGQVLLGERSLPEGSYKKLQFIIGEAFIKKEDRIANLAVSTESMEMPISVITSRDQNTSIFVNWNADASVVDGYLFKPVVTIKSQVPELSTMLIYVTNENSNNVSVINKQSGEVVATIMVGEKPRGIAAVLNKQRSRVYVANSGSNTVSVIDPTTNRVENEISIKFGKKPEGIAVAAVSSEKELIFVTNYSTNSVSVIDSTTFQEIEKIDVGQGPVAVAVDPSVDVLLGTRYLSFEDINIIKSYRENFFNVYVVNKNSNDVSVIRMNKTTDRSEEVINVNVDWNPRAVAVDYKRGRVYIVNHGSDKLSVIDIVRIVKGNSEGSVSVINNVGNFINGVISDPTFNRIYLLKEIPGEIIIMRPFSDSFNILQSVMPPVMGTIPVGKYPRSFILGPENRKIYVTNRGSNTISVVDKTTKKEEQVIHVGKTPYGIAIFQN